MSKRLKSQPKQRTTGTVRNLPEPFSAAPYRLGKHCLYINKDDRMLVQVFAADYSTKKFLDVLIGDDELALTRGISGEKDTIRTSTGITIRSAHIQYLLDYEYKGDEITWELPEPYLSQAHRFRSNSYHEHRELPVTPREDKPKREPREKAERAPRESREGLISISAIAGELKMDASEARGILRKMKVDKPAQGWMWDKNQVDTIRKLLQSNK